jgi:hypothetical protein
MAPKGDDVIEVKCPDCGANVKVDREKAEREFKATCPKGHEIQLAKMI